MATFIVPPSSCDWTAYTAGEENGHQWTLYPTGSNRWTNWTCGHRFRGLRPTDSQGGLLSPSGFPLIIMRSFGYQRSARNLSLKHTGPTVGHLKHLGRLGRVWEQICLVCSVALEAFWTRTASVPIQLRRLAVGGMSHWILWLVVW